jgi:Outer membrane protein beta-barrel domain
MRVLSGVLGFILLGGSPALAQGLGWGVKGGVNFATQRSDQDQDDDVSIGYRIGIVGGAFFTWPMGDRFAFQPEVLYSEQGSTVDELGVKAKTKVDYLQVPVLVRYRVSRSVFVTGGPSMGFKLRAKASAEFGDSSSQVDISEFVEDFDLGIAVGGGMEFGRYAVEGRYTFGLSNISADEDNEEKIRNRVISILGGVRF